MKDKPIANNDCWMFVLLCVKEPVASSDDYGKDLEHLEVLQKKFSDFQKVSNLNKIEGIFRS